MANKTQPGPKKTTANPTADEILELWRFSIQAGLGNEKTFAQDITVKHKTKLLKAIQDQLDGNKQFGDVEKQNTMIVAMDTGRICRMLTTKNTEVDLKTFNAVFDVVKKFHQTCLAPNAPHTHGAWCDEGA